MNYFDNIQPHATQHKSRVDQRRCKPLATERRMPKMHWRWRHRGRDILSLFSWRFGSALPDDDAGLDAAKLLAQHYMRLNLDAERVTKANLRIWAPCLTEEAIARIIKDAKGAKAPSAKKLGKDFRVTAKEVAGLGLRTITAFTVTLDGDRVRQARRRRKAGANDRRGRPSLGLSAEQKKARTNAQAAKRMRKLRALRKNNHAPSYIEGMKRDELSVTQQPSGSLLFPATAHWPPSAPARRRRARTLGDGGVAPERAAIGTELTQ